MDLISISQLLDSISKRIPLPDNLDSIIALPAHPPSLGSFFEGEHLQRLVHLNHNLNNRLIRTSFSYAYSRSAAARGLDAVLTNYAEHAPAWYDKRDTGASKKNADCHKTVEAILVHMANSFDQKLVFYRRTGLELMHPDAPKLYAHTGDEQLLKQVGFYYQDLCDFFEKIGIENPFQDGQAGEVSQADGTPIPLANRTIHRLEDEPLGHPLQRLIARAKTTADDPNDYRTIWGELVRLAQGTPPPAPLIRFVKDVGITYLSGVEEKNYTQDALRKYLNPKARGAKKKNL